MQSITSRVHRLASLDSEYRSPVPPLPRSVKIELTARCDFQCAFCASHTRPRTKSDMPWERYARLARELRKLGVEQLGVFYLGESFVCDWLAEAIRYAKRECGYPYVFLTTNGRLATAARVRECMLAGLDSLKFAVNAYEPEELAAVAGVDPEEFHVIVRNVQDARRVRDEIERESGHRCALYASSLLIDDLQKDRMAPALAEIVPYVDEHYWLPLYGHKPLPCWPLFKEGHITWDGRLSACCLDHAACFDMGNLDATPFLDAWHSPAFRALRQAHLRQDVRGTPCENCIEYA
jgi:organic radical activating enzyme